MGELCQVVPGILAPDLVNFADIGIFDVTYVLSHYQQVPSVQCLHTLGNNETNRTAW